MLAESEAVIMRNLETDCQKETVLMMKNKVVALRRIKPQWGDVIMFVHFPLRHV